MYKLERDSLQRYQEVLCTIQEWIEAGILKPDQRIPSIRQMCTQTGFSPITVQHAYALLESDGILYSRPRSGFYVVKKSRSLDNFPAAAMDFASRDRDTVSVYRRLYRVMSAWRESCLESFGHITISPDLLPSREMGILLRRALRQQAHRPLDSVCFEGHPQLREIVAKRLAQRGMAVYANDVIITNSAQYALDLSLCTVTRPGDFVLIESPSYFPLVAAVERRQLRAIEIYSHPTTGIDPDQFKYLLERNNISACLFMPVHHFPTGVTYSQETMQRIVKTAAKHNVPIIESDVYGELSHGQLLPPSLKTFDSTDIVLQFGSFADTLGPRYGLGWIVNRSYQAKLLEQSFFGDPLSVDPALQCAVTQYMQQHSYERHLRRLREKLAARVRHGLSLISQRVPLNCSVSRPSGGFMCWLRGPSGFDSLSSAEEAIGQGLSILPGPLFSVTVGFKNFTGLNLSFPWDQQREKKLGYMSELLNRAASNAAASSDP